jgi:HTH-type transcriptional regulator/antitoxin HigA
MRNTTTSTRRPSKPFHPKVIKTTVEHERALARIEELFTAKPGTPDGDELELLLLLVETYEAKEYPIDLPDPIEAIRFRMEQAKLKQKDLISIFGSKGKVSEVLNGKRDLSLTMIRKLVSDLGIPAEVLLQERGATLPNTDYLKLGKKFPITEMYKRGWLKGIVDSLHEAKDQIEDVLTRFAAVVGDPSKHPVFNRKNARCRSKFDDAALTAWQIRVLNLAAQEKIPRYQSGTVTPEFMKAVVKLSYFDDGPKLAAEFLRKSGIHLIVEAHLPRTFLDGAAMRSNETSRIVALTLRYDRLDHFWFVLLHELAHIALHIDSGMCESIVDDLDEASTESIEKDADRMASEALISEKSWKLARLGKKPSDDQIQTLARSIRVHPAIVAGRVRYEQKNFKLYTKMLGIGSVREQFVSPRK